MGERAKRQPLSAEVRRRVKHDQGCRCLVCQVKLPEKDLFIHHIQPVSHHSKDSGQIANRRENLCALCGECHSWADHMALTKKVYLNEVMEIPRFTDMKPGIEYPIKPKS